MAGRGQGAAGAGRSFGQPLHWLHNALDSRLPLALPPTPCLPDLAHSPFAQAVDSARDKHATRAVMEEAGLPTPRNMLITSRDVLERVRAAGGGQARGWPPCANRKLQAALAAGSLPAETCAGAGEGQGRLCQLARSKLLCGSHKTKLLCSLLQAADHVGFPAVIKPIHGAASLGVLRVDSKESLATAYDKASTAGTWGQRVHAASTAARHTRKTHLHMVAGQSPAPEPWLAPWLTQATGLPSLPTNRCAKSWRRQSSRMEWCGRPRPRSLRRPRCGARAGVV